MLILVYAILHVYISLYNAGSGVLNSCLRHDPQTTDNTSSANSDDDKADEDSDQSDKEDDDEDEEDDEDDNALKPEEAKTNPFLAA